MWPMPSNAAVAQALDDDAIQIVIGGTSYQGWMDIDLDSDILTPADAWSVSGEIPKPKPSTNEVRAGAAPRAFDDFREGVSCDVYVGIDRQMAGVIDDVEFSGDRAATRIKIKGRDKGAFLADSEAKAIKAQDYTIKSLAEAILDPSWKISVVLSNEDNRKLVLGKRDKKKPTATAQTLQPIARDRTKIDPGHTISSILDMHTRRLGITWWMTAKGDLFVGKPNYTQEAAYHFYCYVGGRDAAKNNIEAWSVHRSSADRYSDITINGQGWARKEEIWNTASAKPMYTASARDPDLVERGIVRKLIIADEDITSQGDAQNRADYEMGLRRFKAETIELSVEGFRQGDRFYAVDTLATVKIEEADIDGTYYVTQRRFTENRSRRRTTLTLRPAKVWLA
jgi:prophage tail gpP-like protein